MIHLFIYCGVSIVVIVILLLILNSNQQLEKQSSQECSIVPDIYKMDCLPESVTDGMSLCLERGCCWSPTSDTAPSMTPYCYYPTHNSKSYYEVSNKSHRSFHYEWVGPTHFENTLKKIKLTYDDSDQSTLRILIEDETRERYQILDDVFYPSSKKAKMFEDEAIKSEKDYRFVFDEEKFGFTVYHRESESIIFDVLSNSFTFADQFLQISTVLPVTHEVFGLGEKVGPLNRASRNLWSSQSLWNLDSAPTSWSSNLYGSHPFYMSRDRAGKFHGVFFKNSNAMEIVIQGTPALTFRSIGGVFDMYFFSGPTPYHVLAQYTEVVGRPFLPPIWSLGYHQCRYGYGDVKGMSEVVNRTLAAKIPMDVQWADIEYMDRNNDFTVDGLKFGDLSAFVEQLHSSGIKFVPIIDAGISGSESLGSYEPYDLGIEMNVFIKNESGEVFVGKVWNDHTTVWPDFLHVNITSYLRKLFEQFHDTINFDGVWIDMNEPSNFWDGQLNIGCDETNKLNKPPFLPSTLEAGTLYHKTVCPSAKQQGAKEGSSCNHYDTHNLYGMSMAVQINKVLSNRVLRGKRPFIISRSTFAGHGHFAGHWTGDVFSNWQSLKDSLSAVLTFGLLGIPMVGADICGFNGETDAELCIRWYQLGSFYPFVRNHNNLYMRDQDPVALGIQSEVRFILNVRYSLLPLYYTLFVEAHLHGAPVLRPTFFTFPQDAPSNLAQFMVGDVVLVTPVLDKGLTTVSVYLPPETTWFDLFTYKSIRGRGFFVKQHVPLNTTSCLVKSGSILTRKPFGVASNTQESGLLPFRVSIFANGDGAAFGRLYVDDGISLDSYETDMKFVNISIEFKNGSKVDFIVHHKHESVELQHVEFVEFIGLPSTSNIADIIFKSLSNGEKDEFEIPFVVETGVVKLDNIKLDLSRNFTIEILRN